MGKLTSVDAPEFPLDYARGKQVAWLNSSSLTMAQLLGQVVLIDFWTYSCINCQRTLPCLLKWWEKYSDHGLVIIGVHTPEFEFEKDIDNVKAALKKYSVSWPVVLDNNYQIWNAFANHYWPAKYLVDHQGKVIYSHFGEGNYAETELKIQEALTDAGFKVPDSLVGQPVDEKAQYGQTPELYCGLARGSIIHLKPGFESQKLQPDQIYVVGQWAQGREYLEHTRESEDLEDLLVLKYHAQKVYLVMESAPHQTVQGGDPIKVYVTLDGAGLKDNGAGQDIQFDKEGRGFVEVNFSTIYNLIETNHFGEHILRISTTQKGLRCFAFTFGS